MAFSALINVIRDRLADLGISERQACLRADINVDSIRRIRNGAAPKAATLIALARSLDLQAETLLNALSADVSQQLTPKRSAALSSVFVTGYVQAGKWREAAEWDQSRRYGITVPVDPRYPDAPRFGLEVRGSSMDRLYPEGTILVCVRFLDLGRDPLPGERVICLRRDRFGEFEATVKEYQVDDRGRHILWPRSTDPDHQQPIILPGPDLPVSEDNRPLPGRVDAGGLDDGAVNDITITALVIQSVRLE